MFVNEKIYLGEKINLVLQKENCAVYKMTDTTGEGLMTCYQLFPGVILMYNDFHMERCYSELKPLTDMFCIDHCREGRIEWELDNGNIREKFCLDSWPYAMAAEGTLKSIFETLYQAPEAIRLPLCRLKILELLLYLDTLNMENNGFQRSYFHKTLVDKIKTIEKFMTAHPERWYTQEELSARFNIPLTSMKQCFKGVFGNSMYAYMRSWRMNAAAVKLRQTGESITDIAGDLGYDNISKFSNAFREVMGKNPGEFRKLS